MSYISDTDFNDIPLRKSNRENKLAKRQQPRGRRIIGSVLQQMAVANTADKQISQAKEKISRVLSTFDKFSPVEKQRRLATYLRWVRDSLKSNAPLWADGDLKIQTATASVGAGGQNLQKRQTSIRLIHFPTALAVKNEEERSFEQNRLNAENDLLIKLNQHLQDWQTLTKYDPVNFSVSEINRQGTLIFNQFERR